ncbi:MAG TPA: SdrD B-like domain-containing protein [Candidatus Paceibacterota bacterium]|nr:SdrD B-like domain-containing protein [Candidatus Paceibacterota bacterium]
MERIIRTALAALLGAPLIAAVAYAGTASAATVTIAKYVNGQQATAASAGSYSFPMQASWTGGSGSFSLSPTGFNNPNPYQATTNDMATSTSYSVNEVAQTNCSSGFPFTLAGYSTGDSLASAQTAQVSSTAPNFTNLQNDEYVIVWNTTCAPAPQPISPANGVSIPSDQLTSLSWTSVSDSATPIQYFYEVSNSATVNSNNGAFTSPVYQSGAIASTSVSVSNIATGTYYWHVRAQDAAGNYSPWGAINSFTVTSPSGTTTPPTATSTSSISGTVFKDQNGNRQLDSGEQGISGAQLVLLNLSDRSVQPQQLTADANGNYSFSNLPAGTYLVLAKLQQGDVPTVWPHVIHLDGTTSVTGQNFGERAYSYNRFPGFGNGSHQSSNGFGNNFSNGSNTSSYGFGGGSQMPGFGTNNTNTMNNMPNMGYGSPFGMGSMNGMGGMMQGMQGMHGFTR